MHSKSEKKRTFVKVFVFEEQIGLIGHHSFCAFLAFFAVQFSITIGTQRFVLVAFEDFVAICFDAGSICQQLCGAVITAKAFFVKVDLFFEYDRSLTG